MKLSTTSGIIGYFNTITCVSVAICKCCMQMKKKQIKLYHFTSVKHAVVNSISPTLMSSVRNSGFNFNASAQLTVRHSTPNCLHNKSNFIFEITISWNICEIKWCYLRTWNIYHLREVVGICLVFDWIGGHVGLRERQLH